MSVCVCVYEREREGERERERERGSGKLYGKIGKNIFKDWSSGQYNFEDESISLWNIYYNFQ